MRTSPITILVATIITDLLIPYLIDDSPTMASNSQNGRSLYPQVGSQEVPQCLVVDSRFRVEIIALLGFWGFIGFRAKSYGV